jgi:hypothetical protein
MQTLFNPSNPNKTRKNQNPISDELFKNFRVVNYENIRSSCGGVIV